MYSGTSLRKRESEIVKFRRSWQDPVSMVLVLIAVFGIVAIVMFILIPQLGETFANLGRSIQAFIPQLQEWAARLFNDNKEIMDTVNNLIESG